MDVYCHPIQPERYRELIMVGMYCFLITLIAQKWAAHATSPLILFNFNHFEVRGPTYLKTRPLCLVEYTCMQTYLSNALVNACHAKYTVYGKQVFRSLQRGAKLAAVNCSHESSDPFMLRERTSLSTRYSRLVRDRQCMHPDMEVNVNDIIIAQPP